jgi:hypothetical protein
VGRGLRRSREYCYKKRRQIGKEYLVNQKDPLLPATRTFITILGVIFVIGWLLMFWLARSRF